MRATIGHEVIFTSHYFFILFSSRESPFTLVDYRDVITSLFFSPFCESPFTRVDYRDVSKTLSRYSIVSYKGCAFFFCIVSNTLPNIYKDYMYVNVEDHRLDKLESKVQTFVSRK